MGALPLSFRWPNSCAGVGVPRWCAPPPLSGGAQVLGARSVFRWGASGTADARTGARSRTPTGTCSHAPAARTTCSTTQSQSGREASTRSRTDDARAGGWSMHAWDGNVVGETDRWPARPPGLQLASRLALASRGRPGARGGRTPTRRGGVRSQPVLSPNSLAVRVVSRCACVCDVSICLGCWCCLAVSS